MRCLFFLPVIVFIFLKLAVNFEMPDLPKRPQRRWNVELMDANGAIVSSQHESPIRKPYTSPHLDLLAQGFTSEEAAARVEAVAEASIPTLEEGKYIVRKVFPGVADSIVNLFADSNASLVAAKIRVGVGEREGMTLVDDVSGKVVDTFVGDAVSSITIVDDESGHVVGTSVGHSPYTFLPPGRYTLRRMSIKQLDEWKSEKAEELLMRLKR